VRTLNSEPLARVVMIKVSILIPCHNAERWVAQAIRSALEQTWPRKEIIVVDDGSTDSSLDVIRSFGNAIRFEHGPQYGGNVARNRLLALSDGEWLQYLDADDYLLPQKIERQLSEFDPSIADVAYSPTIVEHWKQGTLSRRVVETLLDPPNLWVGLVRWLLPQTGALLLRRTALLDVGCWSPELPCCQDYELYLRLLAAHKMFYRCPSPGAAWRIWSADTVSHKDPLQTLLHKLEIIESAEHHLEETRQLTEACRDAIAFSRLECARRLYPIQSRRATQVAELARRRHPDYRLPPCPAFPPMYRRLYDALGFRAAESVARLNRAWNATADTRPSARISYELPVTAPKNRSRFNASPETISDSQTAAEVRT
jgi:Glycosyl transferase family 2